MHPVNKLMLMHVAYIIAGNCITGFSFVKKLIISPLMKMQMGVV